LSDDPADRLPRTLIGCGGHRTGVDDHYVRTCRIRRDSSGGKQLLLNFQRIRLVDAAPEGDD
jgi:hypothetical protein